MNNVGDKKCNENKVKESDTKVTNHESPSLMLKV